MEDSLDVRVSIAEARLDQLTSLVTRCCTRAGIMPVADFEESITKRVEGLEASKDANPLKDLRPPCTDKIISEAELIASKIRAHEILMTNPPQISAIIRHQANIDFLRLNGFVVEGQSDPREFRISWTKA